MLDVRAERGERASRRSPCAGRSRIVRSPCNDASSASFALLLLVLAGRRACLGTGHPPGARLADSRATLAASPRPFKNSSARHRLPYLYGCIAADIIHAKKYTRSLYTHCHCWPVGWQIVEAARTRARGGLRLRLPVAPRRRRLLAQPVRPRAARHQLRGAHRSATSTGRRASTPRRRRDRWRLIRSVLDHRYPDCDRLVERVVERTLFSFRTNKRIFDSVMALQQLEQWQLHGARARHALALPAARAARSSASTGCASRRSRTCCCTGAESACQARRSDRPRGAAHARRAAPQAAQPQAPRRGARPPSRPSCARSAVRGLTRLSARGAAGAAARARRARPSRGSGRRPRPSAAAAAPRRARRRRSACTTLVSEPKPAPGAVTSFATIRSSRFSRSLRARLRDDVVRLGREADDEPPALAARQARQDVGRPLELERERRRAAFLSFCAAGWRGR